MWPVVARYTYLYLSLSPFDETHRADLDNIVIGSKDVWDALEDLGVLADDNDIEELIVAREPVRQGKTGIRVELWEG